MNPSLVLTAWIFVVGMLFVPALVVAYVMLNSITRALVLAATFTGGAFAGFVAGALLATPLIQAHVFGDQKQALILAFATAAAVAGGVLAIWVLGRFTKSPPWRRS